MLIKINYVGQFLKAQNPLVYIGDLILILAAFLLAYWGRNTFLSITTSDQDQKINWPFPVFSVAAARC
jgi:branched-subunit amino acid transport protein AzlD